MNRLRLRAEHSAKDFYQRRQNEPVEALVGDGAGTVDVSGRLNWVWVRIRGDSYRVAVAYNASARIFAEGDSVNLLWVKRTGIGYYAITGYSGAVSYDIYGSGDGDETGTGVKKHAWQHERRDQGEGGSDPLDLYPRMVMPLRARPQATPDMTLHVETGYNQLTGNLWPGGDSAAFNVAALTAGQSRIDLLYMDGADALQILQGAVTGGWGTPTAPALVLPSVPLAYVYLVFGQTSIVEDNIYRDPRVMVGGVGFVTSASGVTSISKSGDPQLVGDVTLSEGANITLTQVGQDIEIAATGAAGHDILSATHTDTDAADVPAEGEALIRRSGQWVSEAGVDIGSDLADIDAINLNEQVGAPAAPGAGHRLIYAKNDGIYEEDSGANEKDLRDARKLQGRTLAATAPTNGQAVVWNNGASQWEPQSQTGGHTIQDEGVPITVRTVLNFVGTGVLASDVGGKSQVTVNRWEPLANGDPVTPELVFAAGDVVMVEII